MRQRNYSKNGKGCRSDPNDELLITNDGERIRSRLYIMHQKKDQFIIILHNVRSALNVGAIMRTADGCGVDHVYLTGFTAAPHDGVKAYMTQGEKRIAKTALGAEKSVPWTHKSAVNDVFIALKHDGHTIVALEQSDTSIDYKEFEPSFPLALVLGNEPDGIDQQTLEQCGIIIDIPMRGIKESLNVAVAAGVVMYEIMTHK